MSCSRVSLSAEALSREAGGERRRADLRSVFPPSPSPTFFFHDSQRDAPLLLLYSHVFQNVSIFLFITQPFDILKL